MLVYLNKSTDELNASAGAVASLLRGFTAPGELQAGLDLFASGRVTEPEIIRQRHCIAEVADDQIRRVQLDLEQLPYSQCSCRADRPCRHQAAVMLSVLERKGLDIPSLAKKHKIGVLRRNGTVPAPDAAMFSEDQGHAQWHERFERNWPVFRAPFQHQPAASVRQLWSKLEQQCEGWSDSSASILFRLHALLHVVHIAERTIMFHSQRPVGHAVFELNDELKTLAFETVKEWTDRRRERSGKPEGKQRDILQGLAAILAKYAFHHPHTPMNWLFLYRLVWSSVLTDKGWRDEERVRLEGNVERKNRDADLRMIEGVALIHFKVMAGRLEQAVENILEQRLRAHYFFDYIRSYAYQKEWNKVLEWLRALLPAMRGETPAHAAEFLYLWRKAAATADGIEEWQSAAEALLPASLPELSNYYLDTEQYRKWADLYLALDLDPEKLDRKGFRRLFEEKPDVLLPRYHRLVHTGVTGKSRNSYQEAVKALKVLKTIYGKLDQEHVWERYLAMLMERTSRLRAFQEEVRKGKLQT